MSRLILETKEETYNAFFFLGGLETLKVKKEIQKERERFLNIFLFVFFLHTILLREKRALKEEAFFSLIRRTRDDTARRRRLVVVACVFFLGGKARTTISFVC